ncbi:MAG: lysine--tRNA ligase [Chloroflexi bacterium]|nr:lysine--tRNA ligase [Chloroflexota bacterium]
MNEEISDSDLVGQRRRKLTELQSTGVNPFKARFGREYRLGEIVEKYGHLEAEQEASESITTAGRIMIIRRHGKVSFCVIQDRTGQIQLYLLEEVLGERYEEFLSLDIGDIVGVAGPVVRTRRGELSVKVRSFELLTKSLRPLPEKWHGLKDVETRFRQRYADLIVNEKARATLLTRTRIIKAIRRYLDERDFIEVETPMLQPIPGGATARPFVTHHNALDIDLYMRIAPELYLKRLIVGEMDRVYELNRNFRNEGISVRHNPEFTMVEVYKAYADYRDMMDLAEELIKEAALAAQGTLNLVYQEKELDLSGDWDRLTMIESIGRYGGVEVSFDMALDELKRIAGEKDIHYEKHFGKGKVINELFEQLVQTKLFRPTFITDYPVEISPLARRREDAPNLTERWELIIAGLELGTAFSELTNPVEQAERFSAQAQARAEGDEEAQLMDEDFVRALEYGMPPTGGLGVGIDRLVMILTDNYSIREVIGFPHMRPEAKQ